MHFLIIGLIILLSGCANTSTGNHYSQAVQSWNGSKAQALLARWGKPDEEIKASNGNKFLLYKTEAYAPYSTVPTTLGVKFLPNGKLAVIKVPNHSWNRGTKSTNCIAAFEANPEGKIIDTQVVGNGCYGDARFASNLRNAQTIA